MCTNNFTAIKINYENETKKEKRYKMIQFEKKSYTLTRAILMMS